MKFLMRPTFGGSGFATLDELPAVSEFMTSAQLTSALSGYVTKNAYEIEIASLRQQITVLQSRKTWADFS